MNFGSPWAWGIYGLLVGTLSISCGAGDGKRSVQPCPDDCPAAQCEAETGQCLAPPNEPQGGSGNEPVEPSGGMPNEPQGVEDDQPPSVIVTQPEAETVTGPSVTFDFEADEPSSYTCRLDDVVLPDCEPGMTLTDLDSGEHTFSVVATDEAGNESELVEVTFVVNRAPEIGELSDIVTPEDTSTGELPFTIGDSDTDIAELTITATLDSDLPIPEEGLLLGGDGAERTLLLNPALNAFGPAILTLEVSDGFVTTSKEVNVTVTPVNDAPTIENVADKRVAEHAVLGPVTFRVGDVDTAAEDLVVTATSSNQLKVPNANIELGGSGEERTFTITPLAQQSGPVTITLVVSDGELTASDSFVLTLGSTDDEPTISAIADQTTPEDTAKTVAFTVSDPDTALSALVPSASFAANGVVQSVTFGGAGASRTFTVTPKANQTGTAPITITISDASGGVSDSFTLTVTPVNDAPTVSAITNRTIAEDTSTGAIAFTVADVDSPSVSVTASSSNTTLIPNANIVVSPATGAPGARTVTVTPVANRSGGPVTITLTASDGSLSATRTFTVTVTPVNDPPTISNIADRTVEPDTSTGAIAFTVADPDGDSPLTVSASSSVVRVVPAANITLAGSGGNRTITLVPGSNQGGASTITVTVNDGHGGTASDTFVLSAKVKLSAAVVGPGTVLASGTGCPASSATCAALPGAGTVTFVPTPDAGAELVGWSGSCSGTGNGVISPIPTAGITCTATFRGLWARLFHTPVDVAQQVSTVATAVVETPKGLHYLGGIPGRDGTTAMVWNAATATGAVTAGSSFMLTQDGTSLAPVELLQDGADGTVALIDAVIRGGSGLLWFDETNALVRARSYEAGPDIDQAPAGVVRAKAGGLTFLESSETVGSNISFGQLVRVSASGAVLGASQFREDVGVCSGRFRSQSYAPRALAVNADGHYLVAGAVPALDAAVGSTQLNLTLFDENGVSLWGRHIEPTPASRSVVADAVSPVGDSFFVTGRISQDGRAMTGFGLLIRKNGEIAWWKSFGDPFVGNIPLSNVTAGGALYVTGPAPLANDRDLFVARWDVLGSSLKGLQYGELGNEAGMRIAPAASGGFNAFGISANSFGNVAVAAWALRLDAQLRVNLEVGNVSPFEPALKDEAVTRTDTCVGTGHYTAITPTMQVLNANPSAVTIGGAYQATP